MEPPRGRSFDRILRVLSTVLRTGLGCLAVGSVVLFFACAWRRLSYPFELDPMEGYVLEHVARLVEHRGIYVRPSLEFVPRGDDGLFYVVAAGAARWVGVEFTALRLVSIASTVATFAALFVIVRRETRSIYAGVASVGLFAGTYPLVLSWFDVGRPDTLALALSLAALAVAQTAERKRTLVASAVLGSLAVFTRHGFVVLLPALYLWFAHGMGARRALWFGVPAIAMTLGGVLAVDAATGGWYWFYAFELPFRRGFSVIAMVERCRHVLAPLSGAIAFGAYFMLSPLSGVPAVANRRFHALTGGALAGSTLFSQANLDSGSNDALPLIAALSIVFALGFHSTLRDAEERAGPAATALLSAFSFYIALGWVYDPQRWIPTAGDRSRGVRLLRLLSSHGGDVFVPDHSRLAARLRKKEFAHRAAIDDLLSVGTARHGIATELRREIEQALEAARFDAIVLETKPTLQGGMEKWTFQDEMERRYHLSAAKKGSPLILKTWTSFPHPSTISLYLPNGRP